MKADEVVERVYAAERGAIYSYLLYLGLPAARAQDLAQDAFLTLYQAMLDGKTVENPRAWLYRVALNVAISHLRRGEAAWSTKLEPLDTHHLDAVADETSPEADERLAELHAFIARLDPLNRALILLYLDERPYAEIAEILGISETNVATKIGRIKQTLRGQMTAAATNGA